MLKLYNRRRCFIKYYKKYKNIDLEYIPIINNDLR